MSHESIPLMLYALGFILTQIVIGINWLEQDGGAGCNKRPAEAEPGVRGLGSG